MKIVTQNRMVCQSIRLSFSGKGSISDILLSSWLHILTGAEFLVNHAGFVVQLTVDNDGFAIGSLPLADVKRANRTLIPFRINLVIHFILLLISKHPRQLVGGSLGSFLLLEFVVKFSDCPCDCSGN